MLENEGQTEQPAQEGARKVRLVRRSRNVKVKVRTNDAAEAGIQDYIKTGTPHAYWMARSFLLLADIYAAEGRTGDARQYLLSLRQNYNADDDIAQMIAQRLEQLNNTEDND